MENNNPPQGCDERELAKMDLPKGVLEHVNYLNWKAKDLQIKNNRLEKKDEANRKDLDLAEQRIKELEEKARNQTSSVTTTVEPAAGIKKEPVDQIPTLGALQMGVQQDKINLSIKREVCLNLQEELEAERNKQEDQKIKFRAFVREIREYTKFEDELDDSDQVSSEYLQRLLAQVKNLLDKGLKDEETGMKIKENSSETPSHSGILPRKTNTNEISSVAPVPSSSSNPSTSTSQPVEIRFEGRNAQDNFEDTGSPDNFIDDVLRVPTPQPIRRQSTRVSRQPNRFFPASYNVDNSCEKDNSSEEDNEMSSETQDSSVEQDVSEEEGAKSGKLRGVKKNQELVVPKDTKPDLGRRTRFQQFKRTMAHLARSQPKPIGKIVQNKVRKSQRHSGIGPSPKPAEPMEVDAVKRRAINVNAPPPRKSPRLSLTPGNSEDAKCHKCSNCGNTFSNAWNLKRHQWIEKYGKTYRCCHCQRTFSGLQALKIHNPKCTKSDFSGFECGRCPEKETRRYFTRKSIEEHWQERHSSDK